MKIVVLLKSVMRTPSDDDVEAALSPCDQAALNAALSVADPEKDQVTALTAGSERCDAILDIALAHGVDQAFRIKVGSAHNADPNTVAYIIAAGLRSTGFDLIFAGERSSDWNTGFVAPAVAHVLQLANLTHLCQIERHPGDEFHCAQLRPDVTLKFKFQAPAVLSFVQAKPLERKRSANETTKIETISLADTTLPVSRAFSQLGIEIKALKQKQVLTPNSVDDLVGWLQKWR